MGGDNRLRLDLQIVGGLGQIGFVRQQKFKHSSQNASIVQTLPQNIRREAGERQQSVSAVFISQDPAQQCKGQCLWS